MQRNNPLPSSTTLKGENISLKVQKKQVHGLQQFKVQPNPKEGGGKLYSLRIKHDQKSHLRDLKDSIEGLSPMKEKEFNGTVRSGNLDIDLVNDSE
jgi:hypothetical protein